MSGITAAEVKKIAALARMQLSDAEVVQATADLSGILRHFSAIQDIDTSNVGPAEDASGLKNIARKDEANTERLADPAVVMQNVPRAKDGYVQVAGVFSESEVS